MVENEVREQHTELYHLISNIGNSLDWTYIHSTLLSLNFLDFTSIIPSELVSSIWSIMDTWAESELSLNKQVNLLKQMKIKLSLSGFLSKTSDKEEIKRICGICQESSMFPKFIKASQSMLEVSNSDYFTASALKVYEVFSEIRKQATGIFMCFERHLKLEKKPNLSEMIDRNFFECVLSSYKVQLMADSGTKRVLGNFEKYVKEKVVKDDTISVAGSAFMSKMKNHYFGQIDQNGERDGYGKIEYSTGDSYEGYWKSGKKHGNGLYRFRGGASFLGMFVDDVPSGKGQRTYSSGNFYEGEFLGGKKNGQGCMRFKNGDVYEGNWNNDDMHGEGTYFWSTGDWFVGRFERDQRSGPGVLHLVNGDIIEGTWRNNTFDS